MQEEDGCNERDGKNDDDVGVTVAKMKLVPVTDFHAFQCFKAL